MPNYRKYIVTYTVVGDTKLHKGEITAKDAKEAEESYEAILGQGDKIVSVEEKVAA